MCTAAIQLTRLTTRRSIKWRVHTRGRALNTLVNLLLMLFNVIWIVFLSPILLSKILTRLFTRNANPKELSMSDREIELVSAHLKRTIELLLSAVFNRAREAALASGSQDPDLQAPLKARWIEAYFPWTAPSYEIEIWWKGDWLEMCGCGVERQHVLHNVGINDKVSWAFGIGLERMAMLLLEFRILDCFGPKILVLPLNFLKES